MLTASDLDELLGFPGKPGHSGTNHLDLSSIAPFVLPENNNLQIIGDSIPNKVVDVQISPNGTAPNDSRKGINISPRITSDGINYDPGKLPRCAIIYDYTVHPLSIVEKKRIFLPELQEINLPFLRPIFIDGVGVINSYYNCCTSYLFNPKDEPFPLLPLVRCLFYWISRGHKTFLCFPQSFNPVSERVEFKSTSENLKMLNEFNMLEIFF